MPGPGAPATDERAPETQDEAEREAYRKYVVAKIEAGLADSEAGRTIPHAEVVARMRARFAERRK